MAIKILHHNNFALDSAGKNHLSRERNVFCHLEKNDGHYLIHRAGRMVSLTHIRIVKAELHYG